MADRRGSQGRLGRHAAQQLEAPAVHPGCRRPDHGPDRHDRRLIGERLRNIGELKRREIELRAAVAPARTGARQPRRSASGSSNIETDELVWDDRMNELYGYPADGGRATTRIGSARMHPDDLARAEQDFHAGRRRRAASYQAEYRLLLPDGEARTSARAARSTGTPAGRQDRRRQLGRDRGRGAARESEAGQQADRGPQCRAGSRQGAHRVQRAARFADRAAQSPLPRRGAFSAHRTVRDRGRTRGASAYRPRPLQADQRHARPCRRRRHADACGERAEIQPAR